ncbi:glutathione peroxidase [Alkalitalea saponilacus]|uniref:Glutathione peroxidase n=1 Tax=Alkalitalea saponilacus TaxID=889453 RepID=A0A1T5HTD5_9BACT|nr:glutathione peroxidase [Alkalitalea saponilacus]ASB50981.1 glutathione peroxidase [Alkalitalea saponilacus]SKC23781.1 glutathione peroxidase [Alkalitalea saponilacus]
MRNKVIQFGAFLWLAAISMSASAQSGFYSFEVNTLGGTPFSFSSLKGKKVMVVNTASECGLTPQYEQLQALWEQYGGDDFVIIGFPANDFMNQEPGSAEEIMEFCQINYGVTFPMMEKITVVGDDKHPLYQWLTQKSLNGFKDSEVQWNFQKYLIDKNGKLVKVVPPRTRPDDPEVVAWIQK